MQILRDRATLTQVTFTPPPPPHFAGPAFSRISAVTSQAPGPGASANPAKP